MMKSILLPVFAASCLLSTIAAGKLAPGSPAPPLVSGEYLKGDPVKGFENGKVYLVEFWATWCGPCVADIPHLDELHKKFADKGLIVIGQNVWERDESKVKPFVEKMGEKMTYRVAMDDKSGGGAGKMAATWMEAAEMKGIPAAFLVDKKGNIAWIGHPGRIDDSLIGQLLDGTFDPVANAELEKKQQEEHAAAERLLGKFKKALTEKNAEEAAQAMSGLELLDNPEIKTFLPMMRLDLAVASGDGKAAGQHAAVVMEYASQLESKSQAAFMLTQFANRLCTAEGMKDLDTKLAVQFAEKAISLSDGKNGVMLHTLARAQFVDGNKDGAIASEESAIANAPNETIKAKMQNALASYKEGKLPAAEGNKERKLPAAEGNKEGKLPAAEGNKEGKLPAADGK